MPYLYGLLRLTFAPIHACDIDGWLDDKAFKDSIKGLTAEAKEDLVKERQEMEFAACNHEVRLDGTLYPVTEGVMDFFNNGTNESIPYELGDPRSA